MDRFCIVIGSHVHIIDDEVMSMGVILMVADIGQTRSNESAMRWIIGINALSLI
jgi:hypothetical protein